MWPMVAQIGLSVAGSLFGGSSGAGAAKAQAAANIAQSKAEQRIRDAGNLQSKARANLARYQQTASNNKLMQAGGEAVNQIGTNLARQLDSAARGKMQVQLQAGEELGRVAAAAAWTGTGGSTIRAVEETLKRRNAMVEEDMQVSKERMIGDMGKERGTAMYNALSQMDNNVIIADLDFGFSTPAPVSVPGRPNVLGAILQAAAPFAADLAAGAGKFMAGPGQSLAPLGMSVRGSSGPASSANSGFGFGQRIGQATMSSVFLK